MLPGARLRIVQETQPEALTQMMLELQKKGTPQYQFRDARACSVADSGSPPLAVQMGLRLLLLYSTGNATDSLESIRLMNGRMDICMLDFKYRDEN